MSPRRHIQRAITFFGSERKLAEAISVSQHAVWRAKRAGRPTPEMAVAIDLATGGKVSRFDLRPDVFVRNVAAQRKQYAAANGGGRLAAA